MKEGSTSLTRVEQRAEVEEAGPLTRGLQGLTARLFAVSADRWRQRAQFYQRHRDYFPRLASGPFVDRCRELESVYRGLAREWFSMSPPAELVPIRVTASRGKASRVR